MSLLDGLRGRVRALTRPHDVEADMAEEIRFHLEMEARKLEANGMPREEARREATLRFGGVPRYEEAVRDERGVRMLQDFWQDLKYGVRVLRRAPGLAATLIVTLGLGIGAATAVFSVVSAVLLNPLPYPESDRLVLMREVERNNAPNWASHPNFVDFREQATSSFDAMTSVAWPEFVTVLGASEPVRVLGLGVSREYWDVARVRPRLGRAILPEENRVGGAATVVVSDGFWRTYLGADPNFSSRTLQLGGEAHQVVGVMPSDFRFMGDVALYTGYERVPDENRMMHNYRIVGRMKPGVTLEHARAEMSSVAQLLLDAYGEGTRAIDVYVDPLHDHATRNIRPSLLLLLGAAALLLLVACTNVASTLLARGMARDQEIAVRASMGAGRLRIVRQLFTEALVLAAGGVMLGILLAWSAVRLLSVVGAGYVPRIGEVQISPGVLAFSVAITFVSAVLFGLLPAARLADRELSGSMRAGTRGSTVGGRQAIWRGLVGAELAMATMLLIGAGLMVRSLWTVLAADVGYRTENVLSMSVSLPSASYETGEQMGLFHARLLPELEAIPGVQSVGVTNHLPLLYGSWTAGTHAFDPAAEENLGASTSAGWRVVNSDYFNALDIDLLMGRLFEATDVDGSLAVAVVNTSLANRLWGTASPIGQRVRNGFDPRGEWFTVIGVVEEARSWQTPEQPEMFVHYLQRPEHTDEMTVVLATSEKPESYVELARARLQSVDDRLPADFATLDYAVNRSLGGQRFVMIVLGVFAATALILAMLGVYGVVSYTVARRRREIGIRMALGAEPASVRGLIQRNVLITAIVGAVAGAAASLALSSLIRSQLFEVQPTDPLTFVGAIALLLVAAAVASWVPARQSTKVDPLITMREE